MIDLPLLLAFVAAATLLTLTPGVDTAIVLRAATAQGRRPAVMASLGIGLGCLLWGAAVSLGLGALLQASELAYTAVKLAGRPTCCGWEPGCCCARARPWTRTRMQARAAKGQRSGGAS